MKSKRLGLQILRFFIIWFFFCVISYAIVILPFYPDAIQLSRERHITKDSEDALFSVLTHVAILVGTISSFWYTKRKIEKSTFSNFYTLDFRGLFLGGTLGVILILLCAFFMALGSIVSFSYLSLSNTPVLLMIFATVAISEEVIYRGYLLNKLMEKLPARSAIVISSLIFSLMHIGNAHFGFIGFMNIFLSGILLAMIALRGQNLWAAIGLHFTWNLTQAVLGFAVSGRNDMGLLILNRHSSLDYLSGGEFGIEGSILLTIIVTVSIFLISKSTFLSKSKEL